MSLFIWLLQSVTSSNCWVVFRHVCSTWDESQHSQVRGHGSLLENGGLPPLICRPALALSKAVEYLLVLFMVEGKRERKMDKWFGAVSAVL